MGKHSETATALKDEKGKKSGSKSKRKADAAAGKAAPVRAAKGLRVRALMTTAITTCRTGDDAAAAAAGMWRADCGGLPVVDDNGRPCGWITDRDISMALGMQPLRANELPVSRIMSGAVHTCSPEDRVADALERMAERQVRRLAVVDDEGALVGVFSLTDAVRAAKSRASSDAPAVTQVFDALRAISTPHVSLDD